MSVEAASPVAWCEHLFSGEDRATARRRLVDHQFDVGAFLQRRAARPPSWTVSDSWGQPAIPWGDPERNKW